MMTTDQTPQKSINPEQPTPVRAPENLAYAAMLAGGIVLAGTGIGTFGLGKAPMNGWLLIAHVSAAPLFAIGLMLVALTWAEGSRFGGAGSGQGFVSKGLLWLILVCGLVVILSAVIPMTPLFGTSGQHTLYLTHRYSAIVLTAAVVWHFAAVRSRRVS